mmetsp:Transcript_39734/g.88294  ORF Transcript_39734/g.88294 Transcript_39734/m.88294 type:complete len:346 (+) Transcript_39734:281-1318(+)|eukprot:CAMPEP_0202899694 /NCGR_PEP_ID=MMETSP1392-20130828/7857_1 /ASSEMBLY_ACC=CAM_ASM_000868 /TAXON_ID=225041 /ORGANISM="Chlamydomonas chlamydogama, Strain SAG 11-48b" /LENGTH=345 /DNA_ID=CAMNT_0049585943 /DNA_START=197 /DNA_END=1234 /DNA_ORIENTATION=-
MEPDYSEFVFRVHGCAYALTAEDLGRFPDSLLYTLAFECRSGRLCDQPEAGILVERNLDWFKFVHKLYKTGALVGALDVLPSEYTLAQLREELDFYQLPTNELLSQDQLKRALQELRQQRAEHPVSSVGSFTDVGTTEAAAAESGSAPLGSSTFAKLLRLASMVIGDSAGQRAQQAAEVLAEKVRGLLEEQLEVMLGGHASVHAGTSATIIFCDQESVDQATGYVALKPWRVNPAIRSSVFGHTADDICLDTLVNGTDKIVPGATNGTAKPLDVDNLWIISALEVGGNTVTPVLKRLPACIQRMGLRATWVEGQVAYDYRLSDTDHGRRYVKHTQPALVLKVEWS